MIAHLPTTSATYTAVHGEAATWSVTDFLLAHVIDLLSGGNWQRSGGKGSRPAKFPRPESRRAKRERADRRRRNHERIQRLRAEHLARAQHPKEAGGN